MRAWYAEARDGCDAVRARGAGRGGGASCVIGCLMSQGRISRPLLHFARGDFLPFERILKMKRALRLIKYNNVRLDLNIGPLSFSSQECTFRYLFLKIYLCAYINLMSTKTKDITIIYY